MKKYIFLIILSATCCDAIAAWGPKFGSGDSCIVERKDGRKFYFCGKSQSSCAGKNVNKFSTQKTYKHQDSFTSKYDSGRKFFCCNPDNADRGVWKEGSSWYTTNTTATKELENGNGTCNYTKRINICGDDESTDCTAPDKCNPGTTLRNGACVAPCANNTAFESATSNTCIACETTAYQGINHDTNLCIKCDPDTQFFDTQTKKCVSKTSMTRITSAAMKKCYGCPNNVLFKDCAILFSKNNPRNEAKYNDIVKECDISDNTDTD